MSTGLHFLSLKVLYKYYKYYSSDYDMKDNIFRSKLFFIRTILLECLILISKEQIYILFMDEINKIVKKHKINVM